MEDTGDIVTEGPDDAAPTSDSMAIVDIDKTDDTETDDVVFAAAGQRLLVIKAHRVIATMTAKMAARTNRSEFYLGDRFQEVTASEMAAKGLRRGLKSMGFALATVNVQASHVVEARVKTEAHKLTAAVRQVHAGKEAAMSQALTIAAVGINRKFFAEAATNPLKDQIEQELVNAGVTGAGRMLHKAFASQGPAYAKMIVTLAGKIAAMPQEMRDNFVAALDMTSEDLDVPNEDVVPIGSDDVGLEPEDGVEDFDDVSVASTLATAGVRRSIKAPANALYSVQASAILKGDSPLFTM